MSTATCTGSSSPATRFWLSSTPLASRRWLCSSTVAVESSASGPAPSAPRLPHDQPACRRLLRRSRAPARPVDDRPRPRTPMPLRVDALGCCMGRLRHGSRGMSGIDRVRRSAACAVARPRCNRHRDATRRRRLVRRGYRRHRRRLRARKRRSGRGRAAGRSPLHLRCPPIHGTRKHTREELHMKRFSPRLFAAGLAIGALGTAAVLAASAYAGPIHTSVASAAAPPQVGIRAESGQPVIDWNQILLSIVGTTPGNIQPTRNFAIVHAAIYDAVNAIDRSHEPYLIDVHAPRDASETAAADAAAHTALVGLYPSEQTVL